MVPELGKCHYSGNPEESPCLQAGYCLGLSQLESNLEGVRISPKKSKPDWHTLHHFISLCGKRGCVRIPELNRLSRLLLTKP